MLLCDFDVGRAAPSRFKWSENGFAASRQVLFGQGSELIAHVVERVVQREFRPAWTPVSLRGAVSTRWRVIIAGWFAIR